MPIALKHLAACLAAGAAVLAAASFQPASAFVLGPTTPGKWGPDALGTGATITWSLMPTLSPTKINCDVVGEPLGCEITALADFMPAGYLPVVQAAFDAWSAVANITFMQVADSNSDFNVLGATGDIRIGGHAFDGSGGTLAHGFFPPSNGLSAAGDIHFDTGDTWSLDLVGTGFSIFQVMAHELGHALGLAHTEVPDSLMNAFYTEAFSGPQADDIAGMRHLYGAPLTTTEPGTLVLLAGGLLGLGLARRRRVG